MIGPPYRRLIGSLPAELGRVAGYHAGWWDGEGRARARAGKSVRPALVLASARAAGADRGVWTRRWFRLRWRWTMLWLPSSPVETADMTTRAQLATRQRLTASAASRRAGDSRNEPNRLRHRARLPLP
jgi:hypothetical protein